MAQQPPYDSATATNLLMQNLTMIVGNPSHKCFPPGAQHPTMGYNPGGCAGKPQNSRTSRPPTTPRSAGPMAAARPHCAG